MTNLRIALATAATALGVVFTIATLSAQTPDPAAPPSAAAPVQDQPQTVSLIPQRKFLQVDWAAARAAAARVERGRRDALMNAAKARAVMADKLTLPLILPSDNKLNEALKIYTTHDHLYAAVAKQDGAIIELTGSRLATVVPREVAAELSPRRTSAEMQRGYRIERTEYGLDISFTRFGAAYNISILCDNPEKDERCTKDDYAKGLVESAIVLIPEREDTDQ